MSDIINTIKGSKAIIVLLILYTLIAITVIVLDSGSDKSSKTDDSNNSADVDKVKERFISSVQSLYNSIDEYVISNSIEAGECLSLDTILRDGTSGSVKVVDTTQGVYKLWYNENGYYLDGAPITSKKVDSKYIFDEYTTKYYNTCGETE